MRLLGKDRTFAPLLEEQAQFAVEAAQALHTLVENFTETASAIERICKIEEQADQVTTRVSRAMDSTFITPLDKEDLHDIYSSLDDITDAIETAAIRLRIYHIQKPHPHLAPQTALLTKITAATLTAVQALRDCPSAEVMQQRLAEVITLEEEGDTLLRRALEDLFADPAAEPLEVMKWKDIFERLDRAADNCHDVAIVLQSVLVKYA
jgi:uncharacterized protein Yka (UPF0111/DUF47 family)